MTPTRKQIEAHLNIILAIGDTIRDLGEVPSGHLYAQLMGKFTLAQYETILRMLKDADLVQEDQSHLLRWIGPKEVTK